MQEGAFSKLGSWPRHHVLAAEADHRPVRVAALLDIRMMSLRYAGHLPMCIPYMIDRAHFDVSTTADRHPVQHHQVWSDVVASVQLMNEKACCSVLDALQWLVC